MINLDHLRQLVTTLDSDSKSLPRSIDFYRLGLALHQETLNSELVLAYEGFLDKLPHSYLSNIMKELTLAFGSIVSNQGSTIDDIRSASFSLGGLCCNSSRACRAAYSVDLCLTLTSAYCRFSRHKREYETECTLLTKTHLSLLVDGFIPSLRETQQEVAIQRAMELVQALTGDDKTTFLGDTLLHPDGSFVALLRGMFDEYPDEREYLVRMLESCPTESADVWKQQSKPTHTASISIPPTAKIDPQAEIQRRVQQVKDVLPDLGDGYIETVLSYFQGDVSSAVTALLDPSSLPHSLQLLDPTLPARRKETSKSTAYELDDPEAKQIAKERFAAMEQQQEAEAFALTVVHNEYDDDYDDQYDGMDAGGDLGGKGSTYDDVDISQIKIYNRIARETEREQEYWTENRNTNHIKEIVTTKESSEGEEAGGGTKVFRGGDKIKGGRVLGPDGKVLPRQRGGKTATNPHTTNSDLKKPEQGNQATPSDEMTKIQKRRKNDNKAKIGNHHRKDRAQKKQSASGL
ncbi:Peptidase family M50 [Fragilaria crotonensis]|nr:Peptidase family M50 [Fragilaria crotonensis]